MSDDTVALFCVILACMACCILSGIVSTAIVRKEAITRGYAEMVLEKPTDTQAVFKWKEKK